ncbi:unnamed protein product, partial [Prorocentrum cordatum]
ARLRGLIEEACGVPLVPGDVEWSCWAEEGTGLLVARMRLAVLEHDEPVVFEGTGETQREAERGAAEAALGHLEAWLLEQIRSLGDDGAAAAGRAEPPAGGAGVRAGPSAAEASAPVLPIAEAVMAASTNLGGRNLGKFLSTILGAPHTYGDLVRDVSEDNKTCTLRVKILEVGGPLEFAGEGPDFSSSASAAYSRACDELPAYLERLSLEGQQEIARRGREREVLRREQFVLEKLVMSQLGVPRVPKGTLRYTFPSDGACVLLLDLLEQGATLEFEGRGSSEVSSMRAAIKAAADGLQAQLESLPPDVQQDIARRGRELTQNASQNEQHLKLEKARSKLQNLVHEKLGVPSLPRGTISYNASSDDKCVVQLDLLGQGATLEFVGSGSSQPSSMLAAIRAAEDGLHSQWEALPPDVQNEIARRGRELSQDVRERECASADLFKLLRGQLGVRDMSKGTVRCTFPGDGTYVVRLDLLGQGTTLMFVGRGSSEASSMRSAIRAIECGLHAQLEALPIEVQQAISRRFPKLSMQRVLPVAEASRSAQAAQRPGAEVADTPDHRETEAKLLLSLLISMGQSRSPQWARAWRQYCDLKGGGAPFYDPAKHDFRFLVGFLDHLGTMAQRWGGGGSSRGSRASGDDE